MKKPTVISTFAGCGGSSLGYKWAGSPKHHVERIGNSAPPNPMRAIAEHIRKEILHK